MPDEEQSDEQVGEDVLEAFNAEGVVKHPGRPTEEQPHPTDPEDNASDADAQAPG